MIEITTKIYRLLLRPFPTSPEIIIKIRLTLSYPVQQANK